MAAAILPIYHERIFLVYRDAQHRRAPMLPPATARPALITPERVPTARTRHRDGRPAPARHWPPGFACAARPQPTTTDRREPAPSFRPLSCRPSRPTDRRKPKADHHRAARLRRRPAATDGRRPPVQPCQAARPPAIPGGAFRTSPRVCQAVNSASAWHPRALREGAGFRGRVFAAARGQYPGFLYSPAFLRGTARRPL